LGCVQCAACRLLRVLTYAAKKCRPRKCRSCDEVYAPARIRDHLCGTCDTGTPNAPVVTCAICKRDAPMYERCPVCVGCVKSPAAQPIVIRALQKGQAARKSENRDKA